MTHGRRDQSLPAGSVTLGVAGRPGLDGRARPDAAGLQHDLGRGEIRRFGQELRQPLAGDAQDRRGFGRAHEVMTHGPSVVSHLTIVKGRLEAAC